MNTTKALIISAVLLLLIFGLQMFIRTSAFFGIPFLQPEIVIALHVASGLLGICLLSTWCILIVCNERKSHVGGVDISGVEANALSYLPTETVTETHVSEPLPPVAPVAPEPYTAVVSDVLRLIIELSDGKTRSAIKMRADGASNLRVSLGSSKNCNLRIKDSTVAPHHADLIIKAGILQVYNVGYNNGVTIGRNKVAPQTTAPLPRGSKLILGGVSITIS